MRHLTIALFLFLFCVKFGFTQQADQRKIIIDSILLHVNTIEDNHEKIMLLISNAGKMRYTSDTRQLIDRAITIAKKKDEAKLYANSYYALGNYYYFNSQLDSSEIYLDKSLKYVDDKTMPFLRATNLMTKSGVYRKRGNIGQAIANMLNAKTALEHIDTLRLDDIQIRKYKGENLVLNNALANFYNQLEEFDKASSYYEKAYDGALSIGSFANAGIIMSNNGEMLLNQNKPAEALELLEEGLKRKIEGKLPIRFIMSSKMNIAKAQTKLGRFNDALLNINSAVKHYEANGPEDNLSNAKSIRGNLFIALKQYEDAVADCKASRDLVLKTGNLELTQDASQCLYEAYNNLGDYKNALLSFELLTKTKDSIFNENNIKKQTQQEMQYEFNKTQELNAIEFEAKERESKLYSYLAILGAVLALVLGFFFYKNRKKNIQLAKQKILLEATIDEKNVLLKETHHRVKNSFQIVSSLLYLQSESAIDKEAKVAIKEAENRVRSMVLIHQKLYNKDELVGINTQEYFTDLVRDIFESHQFKAEPVSYNVNAEAIVLDIETVTPIGLILNELIVNTLKHAFDEVTSKSLIEIGFEAKNNTLLLKVKDNGKGFEGDIKSSSFGITLMKALSKKLDASLDYDSTLGKGTTAQLTIRKFNSL